LARLAVEIFAGNDKEALFDPGVRFQERGGFEAGELN
jgi:hypothetical protein